MSNAILMRPACSAVSTVRVEKVTRTLELVRLGHGKLNTRMVNRMTGWTQRSSQRYLVDLEAAGLIVRTWTPGPAASRWRITDAGLARLTSST